MFSSNFGLKPQVSQSSISQNKSKQYWKDNSMSGLYRSIDPRSKKLKEEGRFQNGSEVGIWKEFDDDGDQVHYQYTKERVGALCRDGSTSSATGRGACSWHGGVAQWLYDSVKQRIGGTGKYMPIDQRLKSLKQKAKAQFKLTKYGQEFQQQVLKLVFSLGQKNVELANQLNKTKAKLQISQKEKNTVKEKLALTENQLKDFKKKQRFQIIKASQEIRQKDKIPNTKLIIDDLEKEPTQLKDLNKAKPKQNEAENNIVTIKKDDKNKQPEKKEKEPVPKKIESDKRQGDKKLLNQKQGLQKKENSDSGLSDELGSDSDWQDQPIQKVKKQASLGSGEDSNDSKLIKDLLGKLRLT